MYEYCIEMPTYNKGDIVTFDDDTTAILLGPTSFPEEGLRYYRGKKIKSVSPPILKEDEPPKSQESKAEESKPKVSRQLQEMHEYMRKDANAGHGYKDLKNLGPRSGGQRAFDAIAKRQKRGNFVTEQIWGVRYNNIRTKKSKRNKRRKTNRRRHK